MPNQANIDRVKELKEKLERCSIAVSANYAGLRVNEVTELRRRLRSASVDFTVVKNNLMKLACDAAQRPSVREIIEGPTAIAFGYDDPAVVARALSDYIRTTRSILTIRGAVLGDGLTLAADQVNRMATLPTHPQLVASLLGQMQAPLQRLMGALNGPLRNLDTLLQARIRQLESEESGD